jgi:hypothetical protein
MFCSYNEAICIITQKLNDLKEVVELLGHPHFPGHQGSALGVALLGFNTVSLLQGCLVSFKILK